MEVVVGIEKKGLILCCNQAKPVLGTIYDEALLEYCLVRILLTYN